MAIAIVVIILILILGLGLFFAINVIKTKNKLTEYSERIKTEKSKVRIAKANYLQAGGPQKASDLLRRTFENSLRNLTNIVNAYNNYISKFPRSIIAVKMFHAKKEDYVEEQSLDSATSLHNFNDYEA